MSVLSILRGRLAHRAVAVGGLAILAGSVTGLAVTSASAGAVSGAAKPAALHVTGTSKSLPGGSTASDFSEAPDGAVYYASGHSVYLVKGTKISLVLTASGRVLAVAANSTGLFVEVGRTVTEYNSSHAIVRSWTLGGGHVPNSAGLYAAGGKLWAWTEYSTDESGLEYASVYRFSATSGTVHRVTKADAYPGDMAADSDGAYYQKIGKGESAYLVRVTSSGASRQVKYPDIGLQVTLAGRRVEVLAYHTSHSTSTLYIDSFSQTTLAHAYSRHVSASDRVIAGTGAGLLVLSAPCTGMACSSATVRQISTATGATLSTLKLKDAVLLVPGPAAAAITYHGGKYYLVRLAA
jgi:hypothetical protein